MKNETDKTEIVAALFKKEEENNGIDDTVAVKELYNLMALITSWS